MKKIVGYLCDRTDSAKIKKEAVEAAGLCKADLLTDMVREFPSLQGKMGGLYAKAEGYPAAVHQADLRALPARRAWRTSPRPR